MELLLKIAFLECSMEHVPSLNIVINKLLVNVVTYNFHLRNNNWLIERLVL